MAELLDAVNTLLIAREITPVNTLDSGHPMVTSAVKILERQRSKVHAKNWWFNTENSVELPLTPEGWVRVPNGVVRADNTTLIILDGKFYDPVARTNIFTEAPDAMTLIYKRSWEDLSEVPFTYIESLAKEEFIRPIESSIMTGQAVEDRKMAFANMQIAELQHKDPATETANPLMLKWRSKMIVR